MKAPSPPIPHKTILLLLLYRHSILNFLQDIHVRVSVFLQEGAQHSDGKFARAPVTTISPGIEAPGTVRFMDPSTGEVAETVKFHPGQLYDLEPGLQGLEIGGKRSTNLGLNIYRDKGQEQAVVEAVRRELSGGRGAGDRQGRREEEARELAREELNLLAKLIGTETDARRRDTFRLNLFDGDLAEEEDEEQHLPAADDQTLSIDLKTGRSRGELDRIISEMTVDEADEEEEDLLALMDKAA